MKHWSPWSTGFAVWGTALLLQGCGSGNDVTVLEPPGVLANKGSVQVRRLLAHEVQGRPETAWGRAGDLVIENDEAQFVISGGDGSDGNVGLPGGLLDAFVV